MGTFRYTSLCLALSLFSLSLVSLSLSPFADVGQHSADLSSSFGHIRVDNALDLSVRLEARRDDVSVGDGLQQEPKERRVL